MTDRHLIHFSLRWKMLAAFAAAFTVVFVSIALWAVHYAGEVALSRMRDQLIQATEGAARDLPVRAVRELTSLPVGTDVDGNDSYLRIRGDLKSVNATLPEADGYLIARGADGTLDYLVSPGGAFREPVLDTTPESTIPYMLNAFGETVFQGRNEDRYGQWFTAYSPVRDSSGRTLAVVGMDFQLGYVEQVRHQARRGVVPVLAIGYVALILLVWAVSTWIVGPLRRLSVASQEIADGDYGQDLSPVTSRRIPDELSDLAESFGVMAQKVAAREQALTTQVRRLQVQIDAARREQSVREITETDFFTDLQSKAAKMRAEFRGPRSEDRE